MNEETQKLIDLSLENENLKREIENLKNNKIQDEDIKELNKQIDIQKYNLELAKAARDLENFNNPPHEKSFDDKKGRIEKARIEVVPLWDRIKCHVFTYGVITLTLSGLLWLNLWFFNPINYLDDVLGQSCCMIKFHIHESRWFCYTSALIIIFLLIVTTVVFFKIFKQHQSDYQKDKEAARMIDDKLNEKIVKCLG